MNQQGINLGGSAIFFEDIEIVQNLFIAIELVQDLTKLVLSLFSLVYLSSQGAVWVCWK